MEHLLVQQLLDCAGVTNARLLKKPTTPPPNTASAIRETIAFNYEHDASEISALIVGCMEKLGYHPRQNTPVSFETHGAGIKALYGAIFENDEYAYAIIVAWLAEDERLAVIHTSQLVEE